MKGFILLTVLLLCGYKINAQAVGQTCSASGAVAADPLDSQQFYYCLNNVIYKGQCMTGLNFNPITLTCGDSTNPIDPIGPDPSSISCTYNNYATFPYPNDRSRYYYCLNNQALVVQCPVNYIYNQFAKTCIPETNTGLCAPGQNSVIPDQSNCQNYLLCLNGQVYTQRCTNNGYYDPAIASCTQYMPMSCRNGGGYPYPPPPNPYPPYPYPNPPYPNPPYPYPNQNGNQNGCSGPPGQLFGSSANCRAYYECVNNQMVQLSCPGDYYFNPQSMSCGPTMPNTCNNNNNNGMYPGYYNNQYYPEYPNYPNYPNNNVCSGYQSATVANPGNCQAYYNCVNGVGYAMNCPTGQNFDPSTGACSTTATPNNCALPYA